MNIPVAGLIAGTAGIGLAIFSCRREQCTSVRTRCGCGTIPALEAMRCYLTTLFGFLALAAEAYAVTPVFPNENEVAQLSLKNGATITDKSRIRELLAFLGAIRHEWDYTWHTYPIARETVFFVSRNGKVLCRLDVGSNWTGSTCGVEPKSTWPPLVRLSKGEAQYLHKFVGGKLKAK